MDPAALADFPRLVLSTDFELYRVTRKSHGPWWFSSSMEGRFDLPAPDGTCYLATDEMAAWLEVLGPGRRGGGVTPEFLAARVARRLHLPATARLADLTSRQCAGFGVTAEIGTLVPYGLPQLWAARLHEADFEGLLYGLRHDPAQGRGVAVFGRQGERKSWRRGRGRSLSRRLLERLREECGIEVIPTPRSDQLRFVEG